MERGDIGDGTQPYAPRVLIQFEHLLARPPQQPTRRYKVAVSAARWNLVIREWTPDTHVMGVCWDWTWRRNLRVDAYTLAFPRNAVDHLELWVDKHSLPIRNVLHFRSPAELEYDYLQAAPDVMHVVHPDPRRPFFCGRRGMLVTDPSRMDL